MVEFLFHEFCSAEEGVLRDRPVSIGSDLLSVTRRMRDPKLGSRMMDPDGPVAGGVSGYGSIRRSVRAQYSWGPHILPGCESGLAVAAVCARQIVAKLKVRTANHLKKNFIARVDSGRT